MEILGITPKREVPISSARHSPDIRQETARKPPGNQGDTQNLRFRVSPLKGKCPNPVQKCSKITILTLNRCGVMPKNEILGITPKREVPISSARHSPGNRQETARKPPGNRQGTQNLPFPDIRQKPPGNRQETARKPPGTAREPPGNRQGTAKEPKTSLFQTFAKNRQETARKPPGHR